MRRKNPNAGIKFRKDGNVLQREATALLLAEKEKGHIKGPGEQQEWQPQGPGQGVIHFSSNIQMIHIYMPNFRRADFW